MNWLVKTKIFPLVFAFCLASCAPKQNVSQAISKVTPLVSFETQSNLLIITATAELTLTPTPTLEPSPTGTLVPTLEPTPIPPTPTQEAPYFDQFVQSVKNNIPSQVVGVYVDGVLADPVLQQPGGSPAFVSTQNGVVTQFGMVTQMFGKNVGLLAHNYLAGSLFFSLSPGQTVTLVYGDGSTTDYDINASEQFQALDPYNASSNFVDLVTGETLTSTELFYRVYGGDVTTTMQTCINKDGNSSWGRLFVVAPIQ